MIARGASRVHRADAHFRVTPTMAPVRAGDCPVGIVAALPAEARSLVPRDARIGVTCVVNADVRLHVGGVGAVGGRRAAETLIAGGARALVSWGLAAGLDPVLVPGTLIIGTRVVHTTVAASAAGRARRTGHEPDETPDANVRVSSEWADRLSARFGGELTVVRGAIACPDHVLRTAAEKRALGASGAVAADMETAAIAAVAVHARVPWLAIRVVVDTMDLIVPESVADAVDSAGRVRMARLLTALVRHPSDLTHLPALARAYRRALRTLAIVAGAADAALLARRATPDGQQVDPDTGAAESQR